MKDKFEDELKKRLEMLQVQIKELQKRHDELLYLKMLYDKEKKK